MAPSDLDFMRSSKIYFPSSSSTSTLSIVVYFTFEERYAHFIEERNY